MDQSEYLFTGTYLTILLSVVLPFILWKRFERFDTTILVGVGALFGVVVLAGVLGISLVGTLSDAAVMFFTYLALSVSALKLTNMKFVPAKVFGWVSFIPFCLVALLSLPGFLAVLFIVADFETEYEMVSPDGYRCRVSSYGNATTSTGGYSASIFKTYVFLEKRMDFVHVDNTRKPEITAERVCTAALSELKS